MVRHLVAILVALIELLDAEAVRLKLGLRKLLTFGALAAVAAVVGPAILVFASGFVLWALFLALESTMSLAAAALVTALIVGFVFGGAAWLVSRRLKRT